MGYNGFLSGAPHVSIVKDNHEQAIVHSEINAITDCAKRGVQVSNASIYITHFPCLNCFRTIASSNIKEIVYLNDYNNDEIVWQLSEDVNIIIRQYKC
jgi:dCMP deaminase